MNQHSRTDPERLPLLADVATDLPPTCLVRFFTATAATSWGYWHAGTLNRIGADLPNLMSLPLEEAQRACDSASEAVPLAEATILAPVDHQEVWASGVTYERSLAARLEESDGERLYQEIYSSERPELFFKSVPHRVVGHGGNVGIRADSNWNTPEPELALFISSDMRIFGAASSNDMSSREIEGANALYLPQAKCYEKACAIGPGVVPLWALPGRDLEMSIAIDRDGARVFQDSISTARLQRSWEDLVSWLGRGVVFPSGAVLMTGTGVAPPAEFTLQPGDVIEVAIEHLGTLRNIVEEIDPLGLGPLPAQGAPSWA